MLAGVIEPAARMVRQMAEEDSRGDCRILGSHHTAGPDGAALANGVAAHALDFDDMCFVSLAHPSCALVPAILATGEMVRSWTTMIAAGAGLPEGHYAEAVRVIGTR